MSERISEDLLLLMTQSNTLLYGKEMAAELLALRAALRQISEGQMVGYEAQTIARAALKEQP